MTFVTAVLIALGAGLASGLGAWRLIHALGARGVLDRPNERSSHDRPTPRGGGIAVVGAVLLGWTAVALGAGALDRHWIAFAAALGLAMLSWRDDRRGLPVHVRLMGHAVAVVAALWSMPGIGGLFGAWLPAWLGFLVLALAWLWFVNLFNFMDGIDGLAGGEALSIGLGVAAVAAFAGLDASLGAMGGVAAAAALGFLLWNWHPARIFLGDVGSVPLGFIFGYLLLRLAEAGQWAAALILPLYFLADATVTLAGRALRGRRVWQAHKEHFYQRAVAHGMSHARVAALALAANAAQIGSAVVATAGLRRVGHSAAAAAVGVTLWILARA
ncbi:MAG: MraY family glycosyltransferase [Rhodospirillales bacterium]